MAGLTCASRLIAAGFSVRVFEKSRGIGGRIATRRTADGLQFDHGAQYFTATTPAFQDFTSEARRAGNLEGWLPDGRPEMAASQRSPLVVAHDWHAAEVAPPPTLDEALAAFTQPPLDRVAINLDIKLAGREEEIVELLDRPNLELAEVPALRWHRWAREPRLGPPDIDTVVAHSGLRAPFAFPDGAVTDWVLSASGWRVRGRRR